jgi:hypothetical protein
MANTAAGIQEANSYQLSGDGITISYSSTALAGGPLFHYQDRRNKKDFKGKEVRTETSELGTLVSVNLELLVDRGSTTFTVLIPRVNVGSSGPSADVSTYGFTTEHRTSIGGPIMPGQLDTYAAIELKGKAELRLSLAPAA